MTTAHIRHRKRGLLLSVFIVAVMVAGFALQANAFDPPHDVAAVCNDCHNAEELNEQSGGSIDNTPLNLMCGGCHPVDPNKTGDGENKVTHSAKTTQGTDWGGSWTYECRTCHNPHWQSQVRVDRGLPDSALYLEVLTLGDPALTAGNGAEPAVMNVIHFADPQPTWTNNQWRGYYVRPDIQRSMSGPYIYRIIQNDANTLTVDRHVQNGSLALPGSQAGIAYGKLLHVEINSGRLITNASGQTTYDSPNYGFPTPLRQVVYTAANGVYSGSPPGEGANPNSKALCVVCHTRTKYNNIGFAISNHVTGRDSSMAFDPATNPDYWDTGNAHLYTTDGTDDYDSSDRSCWDPTRSSCHKPPEEGFGAGAECGVCHGQTISGTSDLVKKRLDGSETVTTTGPGAIVGAHPAHGGGCAKCHDSQNGVYGMNPPKTDDPVGNLMLEIKFTVGDNASAEYDGRTQANLFDSTSGDQFMYNTVSGHVSGQYGNGNLSCSNVYCHSPVRGTASAGITETPTWDSTFPPSNCGECHLGDPAIPPELGSHGIHVSSNTTSPGVSDMMNPLDCGVCHPGVRANYDGFTPTSHVNGEVNWDLTSYSGARYNGSAIGTRPGTDIAPVTYAQCENLYCHSNADPVNGSPVPANQTWGAAVTMACDSCHNNPASGSKNWSFPHTEHTNPSGYGFTCDDCHNAVVSDNTTFADKSLHVDGTKQVDFSVTANTYEFLGSWQCSNVSCHGTGARDAAGTDIDYKTANWTDGAQGCDYCHEFTSDTTGMTDSGIYNMSAAHIQHAATDQYGFTCNKCHNDTTTTGTSITTYANHTDGTTQVAWGGTVTGDAYETVGGADSRNCSNVYCHSAGTDTADGTPNAYTANWDTLSSGDCGTCHGATAASLPDSPAHDKHAGDAGDQYQFGCNECHVSVTSDGVNVTNRSLHVDGIQTVAFDTLGETGAPTADYTDSGEGSETCSNVYCHSNGLPLENGGWTGESNTYVQADWDTDVGGLDCGGCHNKLSDTAAGGRNWSSAHSKHVGGETDEYGARVTCNACHNDITGDGTSIATTSLHVNGAANVIFNTNDYGTNADFTSPTCSNVACHSSANGEYANLDWDNGALACDGCHRVAESDAAMKTGARQLSAAHIRHVALDNYGDSANRGTATIQCDNCHTDTATDNSTLSSSGFTTYHVNMTNDVAFDVSDFNGAQHPGWFSGAAVKQCDNLWCHSTGHVTTDTTVSGYTTPQWTDTFGADTCNSCHQTPPGGSVAAHGKGPGCTTCHETLAGESYPYPIDPLEKHRHVDGTVDALANCSGCHGQPPTNNLSIVNSNAGATTGRSAGGLNGGAGQHVLHDSAGFSCFNCHAGDSGNGTGPAHIGTVVDFEFSQNAGATKGGWYQGPTMSNGYSIAATGTGTTVNTSGTWPANSRTCNNIYCHSDGGAYGSSPVNKAADWDNNIAGANCDYCHGGGGQYVITNAHPRHADTTQYNFTCYECHSQTVNADETITTAGQKAQHVDVTKDVAFANISGDADPYSSAPNCTNVYCHSSGTASSRPYEAPNTPPAWNDTGFPNDCSGCHGGNAASAAPIGASTGTAGHTAHINNDTKVGRNIGCTECHNATAVSDTSVGTNYGNHINKDSRLVNIKFSGSWFNAGDNPRYDGNDTQVTNGYGDPVGDATGTGCQNVYCHSEGNLGSGAANTFRTVTWDDTIDCTGCHGSAGSYAYPDFPNVGPGDVDANSHPKHVADNGFRCRTCHMDTTDDDTSAPATPSFVNTVTGTHINRSDQDVVLEYIGGPSAGQYVPGTKSCTNTYCHDAAGIQWGAPTLGCDNCHDADNSTELSPTHAAHFDNATAPNSLDNVDSHTTTNYGFACKNCHPDSGASLHVKGPVSGSQDANIGGAQITTADYTPGTGASDTRGYNYTQGTCDNVYCHSDGDASGYDYKSPAWDGSSLACNSCHNAKGDGTRTWSTRHETHLFDYSANTTINCDDCHNSTTTNSTGIADKTLHVNYQPDVTFATGNVQNGDECANTYCHSNGTTTSAPSHGWIDWATAPATTCTSCHATDAIATNKHQIHVDTSGAYGFGCSDCHQATAVSNTSVAGNEDIHVNELVNIRFDTFAATGGSQYSGNGTQGADGWGDAPGGAGTCDNIYCHSSGNTNNSATPSYTNGNGVAWNGTVGCDQCHGDDASNKAHPIYATQGSGGHSDANSHVAHVEGRSIGCDECHIDSTHDTAIPPTFINATGGTHVDGFESVNLAAGGGGSYASASGTCSTNDCHGGTSPSWGIQSAGNNCVKCHGVTGGTTTLEFAPGYNGTGKDTDGQANADDANVGAHDAHLRTTHGISGTDVECTDCHAIPADSTAGIMGHLDGRPAEFNWQSNTRAAGWGNVVASNIVYNGTTCANTYCHGNGTDYGTNSASATTVNKGANRTPTWSDTTYIGATGSADYDTDCAQCHGFPPYGYSGSTHDVGMLNDGSRCAGCHPHFEDAGANEVNWGANGSGIFATVANAALHINGAVEAAGNCNGCHLTTGGDVERWTTGSSPQPIIDQTEWETSGHGKASGTYPSGNTAANFAQYNADEQCYYCHADTPNHEADANNLFRLRDGENGIGNSTVDLEDNYICLICHGTGEPGYDPGSGNITSTVKVNARHYNTNGGLSGKHSATYSGGQFCWDCHDPHGDATGNYFMVHLNPWRQSDATTRLPVAVVTTDVVFTGEGAGDYDSGAGGGGSPWNGICQVCHTQTNYYRNDGTEPTTDHNLNADCTSCHSHNNSDGFDRAFEGSGESEGGSACGGCHKGIYQRMHSGIANMVYKHYMESDTTPTAGDFASYPNTDTPTLASRTCLMCHVDHDVFRPDLNSANLANRAENIRTSATVQPSYSTGRTNNDFDPSTGGICLSCHYKTQTKHVATNNGVQSLPPLPYTGVGTASGSAAVVKNSSHNYAVQSGLFGDDSQFTATCLKCHNDTMDIDPTKAGYQKSKADGQTGEVRFGIHQSAKNNFLSPMGTRLNSEFKSGVLTSASGGVNNVVGLDFDIQKDYTGFALVITNAAGDYSQRQKVVATDDVNDTVTVDAWAGGWEPVDPANNTFFFEITRNITSSDEVCFSCHSTMANGWKDSNFTQANMDFYNTSQMSSKLEGMYDLFVGGNGKLQATFAKRDTNALVCMEVQQIADFYKNFKAVINGYRGTITASTAGADGSAATGDSSCAAFEADGYIYYYDLSVSPKAPNTYGAGSNVKLFKPSSHPLDSLGRHTTDEPVVAPATEAAISMSSILGLGDTGTCENVGSTTDCTDTSKNWAATSAFNGADLTFTSGECKGKAPISITATTDGGFGNIDTISYSDSSARGDVDGDGVSDNCTPTQGDGYFIGSRHISCVDCHNPHAAQRKPAGEGGDVSFVDGNATTASGTTQIKDTRLDLDKTGWSSGSGNPVTGGEWSDHLLVLVGKDDPSGGNNYATGDGYRQVRQVVGSTTDNVDGTIYRVSIAFDDFTVSGAAPDYYSYEVIKFDGKTGPGGKGVWGVQVSGFTTPTVSTQPNSDDGLQPATQFSFTKVYDSGGDVGGMQYEQCIRCHSYYGFMDSPPTVLSGGAKTSVATTSTDLVREINPNNLAHHAIVARGQNQPLTDNASPWAPYVQTVTFDSEVLDTKGGDAGTYICVNEALDPAVGAGSSMIGDGSCTFGNGGITAIHSPELQNSCANGEEIQLGTTGDSSGCSAGDNIYLTQTGGSRPKGFNSNWPAFADTGASASGTTLTFSSAMPVTVQPGWFVMDMGTLKFHEVTSVDSSTQVTLASAPTTQGTGTFKLTAGLGNTFVPPYGPWSILRCTDCHGSTLSDPLGPHASVNKWMIKSLDTTLSFQWYSGGAASNVSRIDPGNASAPTAAPAAFAAKGPTAPNYFCLNCHRGDVYPWECDTSDSTCTNNNVPTYMNQSRVPHGDTLEGQPHAQLVNLTYWGVNCRHCHAGERIGAIHGANTKNAKRFLNGSSWGGIATEQLRATSSAAGSCYTNDDVNNLNECAHHGTGTAYAGDSKAYYDYD